jgi:hypothetical protein
MQSNLLAMLNSRILCNMAAVKNYAGALYISFGTTYPTPMIVNCYFMGVTPMNVVCLAYRNQPLIKTTKTLYKNENTKKYTLFSFGGYLFLLQ